jgi:hypothetical protein
MRTHRPELLGAPSGATSLLSGTSAILLSAIEGPFEVFFFESALILLLD